MPQVSEISTFIQHEGSYAHSGLPLALAEDWARLGMELDEIRQWVRAGCFPNTAYQLAGRGARPEHAARKPWEFGIRDENISPDDTVGMLVRDGRWGVRRAIHFLQTGR